jgi:hypothetical protein
MCFAHAHEDEIPAMSALMIAWKKLEGQTDERGDGSSSCAGGSLVATSSGVDGGGSSLPDCEYFRSVHRFIKTTFGAAYQGFFNHEEHARCFCNQCHSERGDNDSYGRCGSVYALPLEWARVALRSDSTRADVNRAYESWHNLYHGTTVGTVEAILQTGALAKKGDTVVGGNEIGVREGHIEKPHDRANGHTGEQERFDPNQIFMSPSIKYAGNPEHYAKQVEWEDSSTKMKYLAQVVFQVRVRPGAKGGCICAACVKKWSAEHWPMAGGAGCKIGPETIEAVGTIDPIFNNSEIEWYTKDEEKGAIICTGLLVRLEPMGPGAGTAAGSRASKGGGGGRDGGEGATGRKRSRSRDSDGADGDASGGSLANGSGASAGKSKGKGKKAAKLVKAGV